MGTVAPHAVGPSRMGTAVPRDGDLFLTMGIEAAAAAAAAVALVPLGLELVVLVPSTKERHTLALFQAETHQAVVAVVVVVVVVDAVVPEELRPGLQAADLLFLWETEVAGADPFLSGIEAVGAAPSRLDYPGAVLSWLEEHMSACFRFGVQTVVAPDYAVVPIRPGHLAVAVAVVVSGSSQVNAVAL